MPLLLRPRGLTLLAGALASMSLAAPADAATASKLKRSTRVLVRECTEQALRTAVDQAPSGATIGFACKGTITLTPEGGGGIEVATDETGDRRLTIDGSGRDITLSGGGLSRILAVDGGVDLTLRNLTLRDGASPADAIAGGGAALVLGTLRTDGVTFSGNHAYENGGAIEALSSGAQLFVRNSRFLGNGVTCSARLGGGGGAISIRSPRAATIRSSVFEDNYALGSGAGGAIAGLPPLLSSRDPETLTVADSRFARNVTSGPGLFSFEPTVVGGGAIAVVDRGLAVSRSRFERNQAQTSGVMLGGAIAASTSPRGSLRDPKPFTVERSSFDRNSVVGLQVLGIDGTGWGGAIGITGRYAGATVSGSTLTANSAPSGGALHTSVPLAISRSVITDNVAAGPQGTRGDAALVTAGTTTLTGTRLSGNAPADCAATLIGEVRGTFVDGGGNRLGSPGACFDPAQVPDAR